MWGAGLGLLVLLMGVGLYLYLEASSAGPAIKAGNEAKAVINQIGGKDDDGEKSTESAKLEGLTEAGKLRGLLVDDVKANGSYARFFGLQKDDTITGLEYQGFKQTMRDFADDKAAIEAVDEAFRRSGHLFVMRDEKEVQLPAANGGAAGEPAKHSGDPLQNQLDAIQHSGR